MNEHVDYSAKDGIKGSTRFFWWCAGADKRILTFSSYSDHVKYVGLGGIVLATGILATISMFFAINYIFEDVRIAIPVGFLWGGIIFNLDRFIVSTVKGAASNEKDILTNVTNARAGISNFDPSQINQEIGNAKNPQQLEAAGKKINAAINLAFEAYPQIRSTEAFISCNEYKS